MIDPNIALEASAALITATGGIYTAIRHINHKMAKKRESYRQAILDQANREMGKIRNNLEEKIKDLEIKFETQKDNISKDLVHMRDTYNSEIRVLGQRIEELRQDLSQQHQGLVNLLTRLIDK